MSRFYFAIFDATVTPPSRQLFHPLIATPETSGQSLPHWEVRMAEMILFVDRAFGGFHTPLFDGVRDLSQLSLGGVGSGLPGDASWNNIVSSLVVISGQWQCFAEIAFQSPMGQSLGPDTYIADLAATDGFTNDSISSIGRA